MKPEIDTTIQFSGLKTGKYTYDFQLGRTFFERYENEELSDGEVYFKVEMEKSERMLLFDFVYHGKIRTTCDRCLGEMEVPLEGRETLCVKFSDTETNPETGSTQDEDVLILPEGSHQIDLAQWMYEYVAVAMPMQKVHPEGECDPEMLKYITDERAADEEGETREADPRWDALKQLIEK